MNNEQVVFIDGMIVKRRDNAPEYVPCNLSFKVSEMIAFLTEHDNGGWVNADVKLSKSGKLYGALDTWKPTPKDEYQQGMGQARQAAQQSPAPAPASGGRDDFSDDIPF